MTTAAGMPCSCIAPSAVSPGERIVTLIGSTIRGSSARSSKPCQLSPGRSIHSSRSSLGASSAAVGPPHLEPPGRP